MYTVVYDACVLYPAPLRDFLLELATRNLFRAVWTDRIHDEWTRNLLKDRPDIDPAKLARTRQLMDSHTIDSVVHNYEALVASLDLPDKDDRHVLAAAIHAHASAIVTFNLRDFPSAYLDPYDIEAIHPDEFIVNQYHLSSIQVADAATTCRLRLKKPPKTRDEYLETMQLQGLPQTVALISENMGI